LTYDEHTPFIENLPAYALGALDAEDINALETHLRTCTSCRSELAGYRLVSESLLTAVPPKQPSAALRKRLQSRLPSAKKTFRPRFAWSMNQIAMVGMAAIALLLFFNVYSFVQIQSLQRQQSQLARQTENNQTVLAMLSYPGINTLPIDGGNITGSLLLDKDRNMAALIVWDLPQLQAGQTYQVWLIDPQGNRTSAAVFHPLPNEPFTSVPIILPDNLSNFTGVGVTVEPAGGSDQPTGSRIFKVDF
jgi:anti-sigma-K factor RskA